MGRREILEQLARKEITRDEAERRLVAAGAAVDEVPSASTSTSTEAAVPPSCARPAASSERKE